MARFFDVHPEDPQPRAISQIVDLLHSGGLIAYPTDSCYALGAQLGNREALDRIRTIRQLDDKHHFTLVCRDFAQLGQFVNIGNDVFRSIKSVTPGSYTPLTQGWEIKERLDHVVDAVVESGDCGAEPTTVIDLSGGSAEVVRRGTGDPSRFE
ncbi:MAG: threonylcarbamoyl-AMP synthase [Arthrobacter sp.]|nr:threonylcarbamoyl-AMP synthase [Arthrobacter sp.]